MKSTDHTLNQLLELIDRYYECSLTDQEEFRLKEEIAFTEFKHPAIDEIKALMGVRIPSSPRVAYHSRQPKATDHSRIRTIMSIAAAIAVLVTICLFLWHNPSASAPTGTDQCIAYAGGRLISDEADVILLLSNNLREFENGINEMNSTISDELGDIAPIIETYQSPGPLL